MSIKRFQSLLFSRFPMLADGPASGGGFVDESEDDDLKNADDGDDDEDLEGLLAPDDDDDEDEGDDQGDEEQETPGDDKKNPEKQGENVITLTQEQLDEIIEKRLARDRRVREEQETARVEQKRQEEQLRQQLSVRFNAKVKQLTDMGFDEESAKAAAEEDVQNHLRILRLEKELDDSKKRDANVSFMVKYNQEKNDLLSKNPLAAKYVKEIDAFSQNGTLVDFETAMNYVLGKKVSEGVLLKDIKAATEQKTLANINKRQKAKVEGGSQPGESKQVDLSPQERRLAKNLGLTPKEWAESKQKSNRKR
jgi:hypothetical protein